MRFHFWIYVDITSSDPFVVAKFGTKEIHRTKHISNNLNPIWTLRKKALFIFSATPTELFSGLQGLTFIVYDYDLNGIKSDVLGATTLSCQQLFRADEERLEMELKPLEIGGKIYPKCARKNPDLGKIAIRCRRATDYDKEFMKEFAKDYKKGPRNIQKKGHEFDSLKKAGPTLLKTMTTSNVKTFNEENGEKIQKFRLRPGPDPQKSEVLWMTPEEIEEEVMKPSRSFKSLGVGDVARIYLEILKCDGLPNLENLRILGNKTDAFVQVVYEDCIGETVVIDDSNSPRWMPWTTRAFILNTKYPSSVIYLGVHDYDAGASMVTDHDLVGRCAVDVTNLRPNTEYVLDYSLYTTAMKLERKKQGTVKIRLRMEIDDPRAFLLASLKIPPQVYVNTKSAKNFHCLRHTIHGDHDLSEYSIQTTIMLFREILQQKRIIYYAQGIVSDCFFWRAKSKITIRVPSFSNPTENASTIDETSRLDSTGEKDWKEKYTMEKDFYLPFNSIIIFLVGITVVEHPHLFPSVSFFSMGWLLMTTKDFKNEYPNPWWRCNSFTEFLLLLILGKNGEFSHEEIDVNENAEEGKARDEYWEKLIEKEEENALRMRMEIAEEQRELEKDLLEARGDAEDISTKVNNLSVDPFILVKPYLHPIQQSLIQICAVIRFARNILLWEESHYSFFIALAFFSLATIFLMLPWIFIFRWSARILIWGVLGPWMRYLDPKLSEDKKDEERLMSIERMKRKVQRDATLSQARIQNENARKYRDFKMYFFGKFLVKVPIFRADRYLDLPLPSSSAVPIEKKQVSIGELAIAEAKNEYQVGQQLVGAMIPKVCVHPIYSFFTVLL